MSKDKGHLWVVEESEDRKAWRPLPVFASTTRNAAQDCCTNLNDNEFFRRNMHGGTKYYRMRKYVRQEK
tara:strand:+ start:692 stop:898 length:207 start_codon:yes stop_codon:yes gene_type:complete